MSSSIALLPDGSIVYSTEDGYVYACSPGAAKSCGARASPVPTSSRPRKGPRRPPPPPSNSAPGQLPGYFMSSPVVLGGGDLVMAVNFHGDIVAIKTVDGSVKWRASMASMGSGVVRVRDFALVGATVPSTSTITRVICGFTGSGGCPAGMHYSFASNESSGIALSAPAPPPPSRWSSPPALPAHMTANCHLRFA